MERILLDLQFPIEGIHKRFAYRKQPQLTCVDALNVRPDSSGLESRQRGGSRPGLGKYSESQFGSGNPIRMLNAVTWVDAGVIKTRLALISNGSLYLESTVGVGGTGFAATTFSSFSVALSGTFNSAVNIQSSTRDQLLYIADHSTDTTLSQSTYYPKVLNPATSTISAWTANDGTIPFGCPCLCTWRDRLVLAGGTTTPHGVFLSRQSDPLDWDFSETDTGAAVSLALADTGQIGDTVLCLAPHSDSCLFIGCLSSCWIVRNDPGFGGQLENLSQTIGVVDRNAWCASPDGLIIFLSADGLYFVPASCDAARFPQSLSRDKVPEELINVNRSTHTVSLAWDVIGRGVHIFVTPNTAGTEGATHWWFDWPTKGFWKVQLPDTDFEPYTALARPNYADPYSATIFGCRDGYLRRFRSELYQDDGVNFESYVFLGPIGDPMQVRDTMLKKIGATLDEESCDLEVEVLSGLSPESAFNAAARFTTRFLSGRNACKYPRVRSQSHYVKVSNHEHAAPWAIDGCWAEIAHVGSTRP